MKSMSRDAGFTLVELMISMFVATSVMAAGMTLYVSGLKQTVLNQAQATANSWARLAMQQIDGDIKNASAVLASATFGTTTYTTGPTVLVLKLPSLDKNGAPITSKIDTIVYQYVKTQTDTGGAVHNAYNIYQIVSPDSTNANGYRAASTRWLFPYSATLDASSPSTLKRSDPWCDVNVSGTDTLFQYFKKSGANGDIVATTSSSDYPSVVLVETMFTAHKIYNGTVVNCPSALQSQLRNWVSPT